MVEYTEKCYLIYQGYFSAYNSRKTENLPYLAHYTSLNVFEKILKNEYLLLSNPLFMNDTQELYFGLREARNQLVSFEKNKVFLQKIGGENNFKVILENFDFHYERFNGQNPPPTFVFCFSEHDTNHSNGLLSMWRGYGANGQGVALIIDPKSIELSIPPFDIVKIKYLSDEQRKLKLEKIFNNFFDILVKEPFDTNNLNDTGNYLFHSTLRFVFEHKNEAFREEREWRIIYYRLMETYRDKEIENLSYLIKNNTIQPKLKLSLNFNEPPNIKNKDQYFQINFNLHQILLGPSHASPIALEATKQMLTALKKDHLIDKVVSSTIPYRANSHAGS